MPSSPDAGVRGRPLRALPLQLTLRQIVSADFSADFPIGVDEFVSQRSHYITRAGFLALKSELDWLWKTERPRVTEAVATAAALGDRSENADYIYGKKRLREIDRRIRFLTKRIDELTVVDAGPRKDADRVYFGAWIELEDEQGDSVRYRLVGPDEFDAKAGRISVDSPVGQALMGRSLGDEVRVRRPKGETTYTILSIDYTTESDTESDAESNAEPPGSPDATRS